MSREQIDEMAKAKAFFITTDSELVKYNGTEVEIIRPLTDKECDINDVGNMYKVRFYDGYERDVFEDEIINKTIYDIGTKICSNFNDGICCVDGSTCKLNCEYKLIANHLYNAGYCKKEDVAAEIFEEIEKQLAFFRRYEYTSKIAQCIFYVLAELKKKYTESEKDNG